MSAPGASRDLRLSLIVAAVLVAADQATKSWAVSELDDRTIDLFWTLRLNLTFNSGMAFSRGEGLGPFIGLLALGVVVALLVSLRTAGSRLAAVAVGLVIGGALGNVVDRLLRRGDGFMQGEVVDFIDLQWWPVFNVADIGVTVGGALLLLASLRSPRQSAPAAGGARASSEAESP